MFTAPIKRMANALLAATATTIFATSSTNAAIVTYEIAISGNIGTFDAPDTGGLLTSFAITLDGVTFDTLGVGNAAPVYNAASNDIRGNPGTEGFIFNSAAAPGCMAMECILSLEDSVDPGVIPPQFAVFPFVMGSAGTVTKSGSYAVTPPAPIPVPMPLLMMLSAVAILSGLGWRQHPMRRNKPQPARAPEAC